MVGTSWAVGAFKVPAIDYINDVDNRQTDRQAGTVLPSLLHPLPPAPLPKKSN